LPPFLPLPAWWLRPSLLVAASGGLDSTVLLDLLERYARSRGDLRVGAAYFDHRWRGAESQSDGDLVQDFCGRRGLPFFRGGDEAAPVSGRRPRLSPEAGGRRARYAFLAQVARREGFDAVATAHHARDQVETLLLRLARGERGQGLAGIRRAARIAGVDVVRPLLAADPADLVAYAESRRLPFREDPTNADPRFPRNRLRRLAPSVDAADARRLTRAAQLEARLAERAADRLEGHLTSAAEGRLLLPVALLRGLHPWLRRELLRRSVRRISGRPDLPGRGQDLLEGLLASAEGGRADLPGARASVSCGWLMLERPGARATDPDAAPERVEAFDAAEIRGELVLRTWLPGDRIAVRLTADGGSGRLGHKKLKALFREARVPAWQRGRHPVLADDLGVLWVVGLRRADRARPRAGCPRLEVRVGSSAWTAVADGGGEPRLG
jgi:tRNA(Ile)-lysidine synthetase-like protein